MRTAISVIALAAVGASIIAWGVFSLRRAGRRARVSAFHESAGRGAAEEIEAQISAGIPVNVQDGAGWTALHHAYYHGQEEAVARLMAFGADKTLRNKDGLTPADMAQVAATERIIERGAALIDEYGRWKDSTEARKVYDRLRAERGLIVIKSLVRVVLRNANRRGVLSLAIKLGRTGSEEQLADALEGYGDKSMAEDYLNCGSATMRTAAEQWARRRGYRILSRAGGARVTWGQF